LIPYPPIPPAGGLVAEVVGAEINKHYISTFSIGANQRN